MNKSKKRILQRLKEVLNNKVAQPYPNLREQPYFAQNLEYLELEFAQNFKDLGGHFIYCEDIPDYIHQLKQLIQIQRWSSITCLEENLISLLESNDVSIAKTKDSLQQTNVSISTCEALIARTGSICINSQEASGRGLSIIPDQHIVVASSNQLVNSLENILELQTIKETFPSLISFISGPSKTADIEKTLVKGAHGPKNLYLFFIES